HETAHGLTRSLGVTATDVRPELEVALSQVDVARPPQTAQHFGEIVADEPKVTRVQLIARFSKFPTWQVEVDAVVESGVHLLWQRIGQVRSTKTCLEIA